jgi:flagellar hook-basal body complex protein FliE
MQPGLEALGAVQALVDAPGMFQIGAMPSSTAGSTASAPAADVFGRLVSRGIEDLNASVGSAEASMSQLATGQPVELQDVMIRLERARISVQAFVQVRNKLVESYQDLMRMQL